MPSRPMIRKVRFEIRPWGDGPTPARELVPYVDDVSLVDLVSGFERAQVLTSPTSVTWRGFTQPHRPTRDYTSFGPLTFDRPQYTQAIHHLAMS